MNDNELDQSRESQLAEAWEAWLKEEGFEYAQSGECYKPSTDKLKENTFGAFKDELEIMASDTPVYTFEIISYNIPLTDFLKVERPGGLVYIKQPELPFTLDIPLYEQDPDDFTSYKGLTEEAFEKVKELWKDFKDSLQNRLVDLHKRIKEAYNSPAMQRFKADIAELKAAGFQEVPHKYSQSDYVSVLPLNVDPDLLLKAEDLNLRVHVDFWYHVSAVSTEPQDYLHVNFSLTGKGLWRDISGWNVLMDLKSELMDTSKLSNEEEFAIEVLMADAIGEESYSNAKALLKDVKRRKNRIEAAFSPEEEVTF